MKNYFMKLKFLPNSWISFTAVWIWIPHWKVISTTSFLLLILKSLITIKLAGVPIASRLILLFLITSTFNQQVQLNYDFSYSISAKPSFNGIKFKINSEIQGESKIMTN